MNNIVKKIDAQFEKKDLTDLYWYLTFSNNTMKILLVAFVFLIGQSVMNVIKYPEQALPTLAIRLAVVIFLPFVLMRQIKKQVLKKENHNKLITYIIKQDEIESRNGTEVHIIKWDKFKKVVETKNCFIFIRTGNKIFLIPKRYFEELELKNFKGMIIENVEASKLKVKRK